MNAIADPEKLRLFLLFAVPGIVALYVRSQFLTGRMLPIAEGIIAYVTLSLIYQAAIVSIFGLFNRGLFAGWMALAWPVLLFVFPAIIGALLGLNIRKSWTKRLIAKLRINTAHPVNAAWDWRFVDSKSCWVLVVLKDGTEWAGYLGTQSFMSSDPAERDIFIEKVYEIDSKTDVWTARTSSVWIAHSEIQSIEFWPGNKEVEYA